MNVDRIVATTALGASLVAIARLSVLVRRDATREADLRWIARIGVRERGADCVSAPAEPRFVALEALGIALLAPLRARQRAAVVLAPLLAGLAGHALKHLVPRERPSKNRFSPQGGQSFPSTHAAQATALSLIIAAAARRRGVGAWCVAPALGAGLLVGVGRIRGAAHWPTDVAAGILLGVTGASIAGLALLGDARG